MSWTEGAFILTLIVGGGWAMAVFMFRDIFGRFPWQARKDDDTASDLEMARRCSGWDDPEDRCPRRNPSKTCVCWRMKNIPRASVSPDHSWEDKTDE